jgi:hypothetical protein
MARFQPSRPSLAYFTALRTIPSIDRARPATELAAVVPVNDPSSENITRYLQVVVIPFYPKISFRATHNACLSDCFGIGLCSPGRSVPGDQASIDLDKGNRCNVDSIACAQRPPTKLLGDIVRQTADAAAHLQLRALLASVILLSPAQLSAPPTPDDQRDTDTTDCLHHG